MNKPLVGLEVILGEGVHWPVLSGSEAAVFFITLITLALLVYAFMRSYINIQNKKENLRHLFLYKSRDAGLTTYQHNILSSIASISSSENPLQLFRFPSIFEKAISQFINYALKNGETPVSMRKMVRDIIIIHEKLYHSHQYRQPIEKISELETGILVAVCSERILSVGKIILLSPKVVIKLISLPVKDNFYEDLPVQLFFWRSGDAGYTLACRITSLKKDIIELSHEGDPDRGDEVRIPLVTTIIPCTFTPVPLPGTDESDPENQPVSGTIIRINEYELTAQILGSVNFIRNYIISFRISGSEINAVVAVLNERSLLDDNYSSISCRINSLEEKQQKILKEYIIDNI